MFRFQCALTGRRVLASRLLGAAVFVLCAAQSRAGFIGYYAPENFTVLNTGADGFVTPSADGSSLIFTGGNTGSGLPGVTDFLITAPDNGLVVFRYVFTTLDLPDPEFGLMDDALFLINGDTRPLQLTGDPALAFFFVSSGDVFGFRLETQDNQGEPGILTVSDFNAPAPPEAPAPEPNLGVALGAAFAAGATWRIRRGIRARKETA